MIFTKLTIKLILLTTSFLNVAQAAVPNTPAVSATPAAPAYTLENTEVHNIPAPSLKRDYDIFVSLPDSYATSKKSYPVLFVTDANYAFPLVRSISRRLIGHGAPVQEFILIGLSYAKGDTPTASRNRDYTPTNIVAKKRADKDQMAYQYGQADAYRQYLAQQVFPFVARQFRSDMTKKVLLGHSYGSLFGAHVLLTDPGMFQAYILGSPSLWYDRHIMREYEQTYAASHKDLPAKVFLLAGEFERRKPSDARFSRTLDLVQDALAFEKTLKSHHYPNLKIHSEIIPNEDHLTVAPVIATRGLLWAFSTK